MEWGKKNKLFEEKLSKIWREKILVLLLYWEDDGRK